MARKVLNHLVGSSMVDIRFLTNNMKFPSSEYNMIFWSMTICSDILHWSDITLTHDLLPNLILLPHLTPFYKIARCLKFHRTFATDAVCQHRKLTSPDTWSCPTFGLAFDLILRPKSCLCLISNCLVSRLLSFEYPSVPLFYFYSLWYIKLFQT